jgi:tRNA (mo5U34)-methyltransferase
LSEFARLLKQWELNNKNNKECVRLDKQLKQLPLLDIAKNTFTLDASDTVRINVTDAELMTDGARAKTQSVLKQFMPWRKGPFSLFGIDIDTEWRSDWKWNRVLPHIGSLEEHKVLDVGCGSGYHLFRMHQAGAKYVVGIDPTALFFYQFHCFKQYLSDIPIHYLPLGIEDMPSTQSFDTVFSMGVLYHRHDPIKFLKELRAQLTDSGQLVLETLVVDGDVNTVFVPEGRYAQMRNVWFLPSIDAMILWLKRVGFKNVDCVDIDITSTEEQRSTHWMPNQSLSDFLDPNDSSLTIEGHPAPKRAVFIAR